MPIATTQHAIATLRQRGCCLSSTTTTAAVSRMQAPTRQLSGHGLSAMPAIKQPAKGNKGACIFIADLLLADGSLGFFECVDSRFYISLDIVVVERIVKLVVAGRSENVSP